MYPHHYSNVQGFALPQYGSYGDFGAITAHDLDRVAKWQVTKKAQFRPYAGHTIKTALGEVGKPLSAIADGSVDINFFPGGKTGDAWLATIRAGTGAPAKRLAPGFGALKRWAQSLGATRTANAITSSAAWFYYNVETAGSGSSSAAATPESLESYTPPATTTRRGRRRSAAGDATAEEAQQRSGSRRRRRGRGRASGSGQRRRRGAAAQKGFFAKYWWVVALAGVAVVGIGLVATQPKRQKRRAAPKRKELPLAANRRGAGRKARRAQRRGTATGGASAGGARTASSGAGGASAAVSASHGRRAGR